MAVRGLAPSRKQNFGTKGLELWIATGDYNGVHIEGRTVVVPANSTSFVYIIESGYGGGPYGEFPYGGGSTIDVNSGSGYGAGPYGSIPYGGGNVASIGISVGPTLPFGAYPIAGVISAKVNCSGNTAAGIAPFVPQPQLDFQDGIILIMDLRE